jgi:hypothetical protein
MMMQQPCVKSELSLFDAPLVQVTMDKSSWVDVHPAASTSSTAPLEFFISGSQEEYLDLNDTILYLRFKVTKGDGTAMDATTTLRPANLSLATFFKDVSLSLNDTLVEGCQEYAYKAFMTSLLQFGREMKTTQLRAAGFEDDTAKRDTWLVGGKMLELMGPLYLDLFSQSKYLLPRVDVRIKMNRSTPAFFLMTNTGNTLKIAIDEAVLYVRRVQVAPEVSLGHALGLKKGNAIYPIQQSEMLTYTFASGSKSHIQDN